MDTEFWLSQCHGYRVDAPGARIGVVEDVLEGAEYGKVAALLVATGLFIPRSVFVPRKSIVAVDPRKKRVLLEAAAAVRDAPEDSRASRVRNRRAPGPSDRPVLGEIEVAEGPDADVVVLRGEHDLASVPDLERSLREVDERGRSAVVDLAQTTFLDSAFLSALADATARAERGGRRLLVHGAHGLVHNVVNTFGLPIRLAKTRGEALRRASGHQTDSLA